MITHPRRSAVVGLSFAAAAIVACTAQGNSTTPATGGGAAVSPALTGDGQLLALLVDRPNADAEAIYVTVRAVRAHSTTAGWVTLSETPVQVNLRALESSAQALGLTQLPAGTVTQLRLVLADDDGSVVLPNGSSAPLKVPSGIESGIKILGPWTIDHCATTSVTLEFDGKQSIWCHPTGHGDEWILRPVIRAVKSEQSPFSCAPPPVVDPLPPVPPAPDPVPPTDAPPPTDTTPPACACAAGETCVAGACVKPPGGFGAPCTSGGECLSGTCTSAGTCGGGVPSAPCRASTDCLSATCDTATGTCASGTAGTAGSSCASAGDCLSGACVQQVCAPGQQGMPCLGANDCSVGLSCVSYFCFAPAK